MSHALLCSFLTALTALTSAPDVAAPLAWRPLAAAPSPRFALTAVHVPARNSLLVFAGEIQKPGGKKKDSPSLDLLHDLWEHDLANDRWQSVETKGPAPGDVAYHAATYDEKRNAMWVFGGCDRSFAPNGDLWRLDVEKRAWTKLEPAGERPPPRFSASLHFDPKRNALVLHGGCKAFLQSDNAFTEVWTYDIGKNAWTKRASGPGCSRRSTRWTPPS